MNPIRDPCGIKDEPFERSLNASTTGLQRPTYTYAKPDMMTRIFLHVAVMMIGSALAINEKKTQRTGGCVGIFLQLFDWKKRFANKKFSSNKLLSLDSAQHGSKRFGADDKLPKLRLMSNEKNGTQNADPGKKHAMRTPTLVARLMGLDSLPAVHRDKIKKTSSDKIGVDRGDKVAIDRCQFNGQHIKFEKEGSKHELKPHKLQKTRLSDRRAVARLGAEGLHFKNVLSRSSKHHHPNFAPPVKSPKGLSKRNAARLIGAATRILEPGLQARNRAKCALPYSSQKNYNPTDGLLVEAGTGLPKDQLESPTYYEDTTRFSRGQSSCGNCGNIFDIPESRTYLEEQPSVSEYMARPLSGLERCMQTSPMSSLNIEKESVFRKSPEKFSPFSVQPPGNVNPRAEHNLERKTLHKGSQTRGQFPSQQYGKEEISPSSICYKQKFCVGNQGVTGRDRTLPRSTCTVHFSKEVPPSQGTIDQKCSRVPGTLNKCGYGSKRISTDRLYDPLSSARKRRSVEVARQGDICSFVGSAVDKQRDINCNSLGQTMVRRDVQPGKLLCISSNLARLGKINKTTDTNDGVVSFTFSSSKKNDRSPPKANGRGYQSDRTCSSSSQKSSVLDKINRNGQVCFQKSSLSAVDTLGFIEQKLKEIRSQGDDEMALGGYQLKRTPAMILQELLLALTAERSFYVNDVISGPTETDVSCCEHTSSTYPSFQAQLKKEAAQIRHLNDINNDMSPLSVLKASILNGSFLSSSLDDGLVHKSHIDFKDLSHNEKQQLEPSVDLLHGTTSIGKGRSGLSGIELMAEFVNSISDVLCSMDLVDSRLNGSKLAHAEEVIRNAELVFGNPFRNNSNEGKAFSICQFIVNELETLGSVLWTNFGCFSESEDTEGNLLKGFIFDCVIEYLDSRYIPSIKGRIKSWTDLPVSMNTEMLIREVVEEIRRWTSWAGFILDEQIEMEMSSWTDLDVEAFETSVSVDRAILHSLIDELVIDLWQSKPNSCILVK
ncbi:Futsch light chain LC(F) like [Heracleum sosnowskyi]|uniref:Futsch light chain LC(F) like n=1 Tax=Heracleum sosnowskyi TaxID=360622 RepID=A0AAD8M1T5_9APIA|nr:Futsch light chain LC(F) like [Heracleum sosnowskyi]